MPDPFISRQDLSDYLGRDVTTDAGALIAVDSACETVRTLTEQDFNEAITDTVALDGTGTDTLLLPQFPVQAVGTVVVNGGTLEADDFGFTEDGKLFRTSGTAIFSSWSRGEQPAAYWAPGRQNVSVTYDHGAGTVPADVRMVALGLAYRMVTQGGAISESVGPVSRRYATAAGDLTNGEQAILAKYRRIHSA